LSREIKESSTFTIIILTISLLVFPGITMSRGQQQESSPSAQRSLTQQEAEVSQQVSNNTTHVPILNNIKLEVELVTEGLDFPTSMAFISNDGDMLISEKSGEVILFSNENKTKIPFVNFTVNEQSERGLLGVAVLANNMSNADTTATTTTASNNNETITTRDNSASNANGTTVTPTFAFFYLTEASRGKCI
jgi:glucose/arabinose dehydrogenase